MIRLTSYYIGLLITLLTVLSCNQESYSEYDRIKTQFLEDIQGNIDGAQMWRTAIRVSASVTSNYETTVRSFVTIDDELYLTDQQYVPAGGGTVSLTVPQGRGNTVKIMAYDGHKSKTQGIVLTGALEEHVSFDLTVNTPSGRMSSPARTLIGSTRASSGFDPNEFATHDPDPSLYGKSILGGSFYVNWNVDDWHYLCELAAKYSDLEAVGENVNYELISKGPFFVTLLCGLKGANTPHIFGYYYHSPGTYSDITFVDIADTHQYDFLDNMGLIQYQLTDDSNWYNLNLQMGDYPGNYSASGTNRKGDNVFNSLHISKNYRDFITSVRGLSYNIDIPEGMRIGFYMREDEENGNTQRDNLIRLGLPHDRLPNPFKASNFSAKQFNINGTHRSWLHDNDGWYFMGLEDRSDGGDMDDNDLMFGITDPLGIALPEIIDPDIDNMMGAYKILPWTLTFEDVHRNPDFDFNDGIIQITPDYDNEKACVRVLAAGIDERVVLHYQMPDGTDRVLGELHELLGRSTDSFVNTTSTYPITSYVEVDCVPWPKTFSMYRDASRFSLEVIRGACNGDCTDYISLTESTGTVPQAILIAGNWNWPKEGYHINNVYSYFNYWTKDYSKTSYWEWYLMPKSNMFVNY